MMAELYLIIQIKYIMKLLTNTKASQKDLKHLKKLKKYFLTHKQMMLTLIIRMPKM